MRRKFAKHFDGGLVAVERGKLRGEIHTTLKKEFWIRRVGGGIGQSREPSFEFTSMFAGDRAESVESAKKEEDCQKEKDAEESEPAHG